MHTITLPESAIARGRLMGLDKPVDPRTTAVVAIDFQRFFLDDDQPMGTANARDALANANRVHAAVRAGGGLVVLTQHSFGPPGERVPEHPLTDQALLPGSPSYDLHPELFVDPGDIVLVKRRSSPLHPHADSGLEKVLRDRGIETIIITGLASNGCCDCLARDAFQHGFNVVFVSDATAAMSDEEHNATLLNLAIYYAQVHDSAAVEALLAAGPAPECPAGGAPFVRDYATDYDLEDPELNERWDELIPHLHAQCPVARSEVGEGYWIVNRHADVKAAAIDWATFSNSSGFMVNRPEGLPYFAPGEVDPPLHTALRAMLHPFLTPRQAKNLEPTIRAHADALIDSFIADGQVEIVTRYANTLPQLVFSVEVAGMEAADMPALMRCFSLTGPMEERGIGFAQGMALIDAYLNQRQAEAPRGDIVDALLAFEHEGYTRADKIGTMSQLTIGGIGTTGYAFSGGLHHLATHSGDRQLLIADPAAIPRAVEEFLRMFLGAPNMARRATVDTEISGVPIAAGDRVLLSFGAANRDPDLLTEPDRVDITRGPVGHLAFGAGSHRCVGSPLALTILRVGFEQFLARIPEFEVPPGFVPRYETGNVRHMVELPLQFPPSDRRDS